MTCSKCGRKVRGVPSPTGVCRQCRGLKADKPPVVVVSPESVVVDPPDTAPEPEGERTW